MLDESGVAHRSHREIARWLSEQLGYPPAGLERSGDHVELRAPREACASVGEKHDGSRSRRPRRWRAPVERLYHAVVDPFRGRATNGCRTAVLRQRTATEPKSARYDWGEGSTRVHVTFLARGQDKSTVAHEHRRLAERRRRRSG